MQKIEVVRELFLDKFADEVMLVKDVIDEKGV